MTPTDTQLVLLSAASQRQDGAIVLTPNLKGSAAGKVIGKLLRDGLVEEVPAGASMPVWRRDGDAGPLSIRITPRGLASIGLEGDVMQLAKEPSTAEQRADGSWLRSLGLERYEAAFHHLLRCRPPWTTPPGLNQGFSR
jgi:hypothetical protein